MFATQHITNPTVIIEPVGGSCNLNCRYCYHENIRNNRFSVMDLGVLERLMQESLRINVNGAKFLWHGGEPMLAGLDFYKNVVLFQQKHRISPNQKITNHLQTNITLMNEKWARFLKDNNFRISTSIDGPEWLHNKCRFDSSGNGSFKKVVEGIDMLRSLSMTVGVVSTINLFNVEYPDEVYNAFINLGIKSFELNIASDAAGASSLSPPRNKASDFLKRVFDLWFEADDPSIYIRIFHNAIRSMIGLPTKDCSFSYNRCREYVACDETGKLYTCGRFLKENDAYIGSLESASLSYLLASPKTQFLYDCVAKIKDDCQVCPWLKACGGGCAYQRWLNGGFGAIFPQCEIRKALFEHIAKRAGKFTSG